MNRRLLTAGAAVAAAALGAGVWRWRTGNSGPEQAVWRLRLQRPQGSELVMAELRGHPLLLNFWATWCPPCVRELPLLDRFQREQRARGWKVVALAVDELAPVLEFLRRQPVELDIGMAGLDGLDLARSLGNSGGGLPFTVVFDRNGTVVQRKLGSIEAENLAQWAASVA